MKALICVLIYITTANAFAETVDCEAKMKACSKITDEKEKGKCYIAVPKKCIFPLYEFCEKELDKGGICNEVFSKPAPKDKEGQEKHIAAINACLVGPKVSKSCKEAAEKQQGKVSEVKECPVCKIDYSSESWEETSKCLEKAQECSQQQELEQQVKEKIKQKP